MDMKALVMFFVCFPFFMTAQVGEKEGDSKYVIVEGDSVAHEYIDLEEVKLLHQLKFNSKDERRRYLILRRKTIKVYPYAKLAAERLVELNGRLATLERKRDKRQYTRRVQKYLEGEFTDQLKKMTRTEGQILVKLIHRQTGITAFDLIKELRSGWKAFWSNSTANLFDISLKKEFDPLNEKEDYLIEDILQRNFQNGLLDPQEPAIAIDFYALTEKWLNPKTPSEN